MVISISIVQFFMELVQAIIILTYMNFVNGYSHILDKFFNLYVVSFVIIAGPSFYLAGDTEFRTLSSTNGYFLAWWKVVFLNWWIQCFLSHNRYRIKNEINQMI